MGGILDEVLELADRSAKASKIHKEYAIGNRYITYIEFGQYDCLDQFLSWIENRNTVQDYHIGLPYILEGFVKSGRIIDA
ncbi:hypothetical protein ACFVRR_06485 [Gottfriedia sp. NPDC057948]|uniref:hypothetical protein n=1 Tax=Gottfriedia sp. NPDC057948 TaxID=3346287 RepID=UPI0036DB604C